MGGQGSEGGSATAAAPGTASRVDPPVGRSGSPPAARISGSPSSSFRNRRGSCKVAAVVDPATQEQSSALQGITGTRTQAKPTQWTNQSFTGKKPTDLEELRQRHEFMKQRRQNRCKNFALAPFQTAQRSFSSFAQRKYFFDPQSSVIQLWDWLIVGVAIYSVVYVPLNVVLKQTRWTGYQSLEILFDLVFLLVRKCVYRSYVVTRFSACFPPPSFRLTIPPFVSCFACCCLPPLRMCS
jgi:hypothetical protein